jgi:hypothetical protein
MKYNNFNTKLNDFIDKKMNNKSTNKAKKQMIYRNGVYKIECIIVNDYLEFWVNGIKFWNINPSTNEIKFFGNIDFSDCNVTGL